MINRPDGSDVPPDEDVGQRPSPLGVRIRVDREDVDERCLPVPQVPLEVVPPEYDMGMCVGGWEVVVVALGVQLLGEDPVDLGEILLPDQDVDVVIPGDEPFVSEHPYRCSVLDIECYPVGIEDLTDVLVHGQESGLDIVHGPIQPMSDICVLRGRAVTR